MAFVINVENEDPPVTPEDAQLIVDTLLTDPRFKLHVNEAAQDAIASKFSTVNSAGVKVPNGLIFEFREHFPRP